MKIFDSHTHLNDAPYQNHVAEYITAAKELNVQRMAIVGSDADLNEKAIALAHEHSGLSAIVGWHPESSQDYDAAAEKVLLTQLEDPEVVALGEIGLDYHWDTSPREIQRRVFIRQLATARDYHLPVSIHSREAFEDTYAILKAAHLEDFGGIMHSFTGDGEWAKHFLDLGMMISYSGIVSFKNAPEEHESVTVVPNDQLLIETDAPYLTPVPYRGKQNQPGYTRYVAEAVAHYRQTSVEDVAATTWHNAMQIFKLGDHDEN